jgi:hypothetical protein
MGNIPRLVRKKSRGMRNKAKSRFHKEFDFIPNLDQSQMFQDPEKKQKKTWNLCPNVE